MSLPSPEPTSALKANADVTTYGTHSYTPIASNDGVASPPNGEAFDAVPSAKRQIGVFSAVSLICNRMIGTGIYATPSLILRASGSVGMFLLMWIVGALVAAVGTAVYVEFGTGLPRSGGEKNYLEYIYRRPRLLVTCCIAAYFCLLSWSSANAVVFGEYMVDALGGQIAQWNTRLWAWACITIATFLFAFQPNWGLRLHNTLSVVKLAALFLIVTCGMSVLFAWLPLTNKPRNFEDIWTGTSRDPNALVMALYNVIWAFTGYSNAHYVLSEIRDPVRIIRRASPLALALITVLYLLANISYLAVVSKDDIRTGGRVIAAYFFRNIFGPSVARLLSIIISVSTFGNVLSSCFAQSRVIQELGREGVIPYSAALASSAPFSTPLTALVLQWVVSLVWIFAPPPGDAYNFVQNLQAYPTTLVNMLIAGGLLWLYLSPSGGRGDDWAPPYRAGLAAVTAFFASNVFLVVAPLIPPAPGFSVYAHLPYWLHVAASMGIVSVGLGYWYIATRLLPSRGGYKLVKETVVQEDGVSRSAFRKVWL